MEEEWQKQLVSNKKILKKFKKDRAEYPNRRDYGKINKRRKGN